MTTMLDINAVYFSEIDEIGEQSVTIRSIYAVDGVDHTVLVQISGNVNKRDGVHVEVAVDDRTFTTYVLSTNSAVNSYATMASEIAELGKSMPVTIPLVKTDKKHVAAVAMTVLTGGRDNRL